MAKIVRSVEDISKISGKDFIIEIEEIEFVGDNGDTKSFKIAAVVLISVERCEELDCDVDWNKKNFHLLVCPEGTDIK